jgi:hypothetical protein
MESNKKRYVETFDNGPGGWHTVINNFQGLRRLTIKDGAVWNYGPWWVDYNHAPPGGGYLNLLMALYLKGPLSEAVREMGGPNRFIEGGYSTNLTDTRITFRLKGEMDFQGSNLALLIQGSSGGICSGWALTGQPIALTRDWSDQTIVAKPDPAQWTPLGSRHDRIDTYGKVDLQTILANVNVNIYLILFPVNPVPKGPIQGDPHILRAGYDYPLWQTKLPDGYVAVDTVQIEYA